MKRKNPLSSFIIVGLFIISICGCKKQEPDKQENIKKSLGEKTFKVGSYQTWSQVIDFAHGSGYVVAGTAADEENGNYPFLSLLDDSLRVTKVLYPACTLNPAWTQGLAVLSDGYVILSTYGGNLDYTYGVYLTKISFTGDIIWQKEYFSGVLSWGPNITSDSDNSILILCEQAYSPDYNYYSHIAKIDTNGNLLWSNDFFPEVLNRPETIITDKQDNYIAIIDSITDNNGTMPVVHKINKDGTILWTKALESNNGLGWLARAKVDNDNNIIIAHQPGSNNSVLKLDPSGNILWKSTINQNIISFAYMRDITVDNENNIYIIGDSNSPSWLALARISPAGEVLNSKLYRDYVPTSEYYGNSIKYISGKNLVVLTTKYQPIQVSVFFMNNAFELL